MVCLISMTMTHYMELLSTAQPWHLIFFMAIPVILAETLAVTELYILFTRNTNSWVRTLSKIAGMVVGVYFAGVFIYLMNNAVIPLTISGGWRGAADIIAVGSYLLGVIPLVLIALLEFNLIGRGKTEQQKLGMHATFIAIFLVVAHVAMIFGMLNPELLGYHAMTMVM